ncbi:Trimethyllysine dioxygenase, mitochondrial [Armadillidium nasatum]|uniref:trimethyllysine dioxygenase n=1 Tax=Armadillidium nasatum TaxID=96803 RepID=A0A5N5TBJ8_9CRUS|nr:Trimethyllysine dioxygenase, mitochondrial [Armadillidium nasatum]
MVIFLNFRQKLGLLKHYGSHKLFHNDLPKISNLYAKQMGNSTKDAATMISEHANRLEISIPRWPSSLNFSYVWLRDHCRCDACFRKDTFQRQNDILSLPLKIRPTYLSHNEKELHIQWPDGHFSKFDFQFLWENSFEGKKHSKNIIKPLTWNRNSFPSFDQIKVPPTVEATRETVEVICPISKTIYGEMWELQADLGMSDTAYTDEYLGSHTDTTYFSEPSRIQVFHCLKQASEGGESLYVDGFHIGEKLYNEDPACYEYLSTTALPGEYRKDGHHFVNVYRIFTHHPVSKKLMQFRCNDFDRAPLSTIPYHEVDKFYMNFQKLVKMLRDQRNEVEILLQPGQVAFIDNWRVTHGRKSFRGTRVLGGCYLGNSDFLSKARVHGLKFE